MPTGTQRSTADLMNQFADNTTKAILPQYSRDAVASMANVRPTWSSTEAYAFGNMVFDAGGLYMAIAPNTNDEPSSSSTGNWIQFSITGAVPSTAPDAPSGPSAIPGDGRVLLSWSATSGTYTVKQGTASGGPYTTVASGLSGTSYVATGLTNSTTYYYVIVATNFVGDSSASGEASATPTAYTGSGHITNGSFETPSVTGYAFHPSGSGWTWDTSSNDSGITDGSGGAYGFATPSPDPAGSQAAFLQGGGTCSQAMAGLTVGATGTVTFQAVGRTGYAANGISVRVDGSEIYSVTPGSSWGVYTCTFPITATTQFLTFAGTGSGDTSCIDVVTVT